MYKRVLVALTCALWVLLSSALTTPFAADDSAATEPAAVTTADPEIPAEELELLVKAFTKDELLVEADAWQALLREKVLEIGKAEIAVKRQNREIERA